MKNRRLKNSFSDKTRSLFENYGCWECGRSDKGVEPHHILKRISGSAFNLAPLCRKCHELGNVHSIEKRKKYLNKTLNYLKSIDYKINSEDEKFLNNLNYGNK